VGVDVRVVDGSKESFLKVGADVRARARSDESRFEASLKGRRFDPLGLFPFAPIARAGGRAATDG